MRLVVLFLVFSYECCNGLIAQEKSWWVGHSLTRASFDGAFGTASAKATILPLGVGFSLIRKRGFNKSEVSFLTYGVEISSIRHALYINGVSDWLDNTTVKIPIAYRFEAPLTKTLTGIINVGLNFQSSINSKQSSKVFNNSVTLEIYTIRNILPFALFSGGFSLDTKKGRQFEVLMGLNKGFAPINKIIYRTENPLTEKTIFSNGSYVFLAFNWRIFKKGY